jgi:hypothetical protein
MTNFKYALPKCWIDKISSFTEFANGAAQVSIKIKNGNFFNQILISNSTYIVAMRGHKELPFDVNDIVEIFQTNEDKNPKQRGDWFYWDSWE